MKKYFLALSALLLACLSINAHSVYNPDNKAFYKSDKKAYFGVRVGADITCPGKISSQNVGIDVYNNGAGIEFGGIYNIPIVANFYIEPGLKLFYDKYSMKKDFLKLIDSGIDGMSIKKFGMRIPVMAGYHFDFTNDIKVSVFTGPELEVGFSAKEHITSRWGYETASIYGEGRGMRRVNLLWGVGAGISYRHIYFGVNGGIGLIDMNKYDAKFHENRVTVSLGYNF